MHRFFVEPNQIQANEIHIIGEDIAHIKVLRIAPNELIEICDGNGTDYHCIITSESKKEICCRIVDATPSMGENEYQLTLFQGYPKKSKLEAIIEKTTELGVNAIIPFFSSRTVKKGNDKPTQSDRFEKIALSAAKQSKRGKIPVIRPALDFNDIIASVPQYDLFLVAYEDEKTMMLTQILHQNPDVKNIAVLIGPEGGLSQNEVNILKGAGAVSVSLGQRILRTETAGMTVIAQINFFFETQSVKHYE